MEQKELTPQQALQVIYHATGELLLNRLDGQALDRALQVLVNFIQEQTKTTEKND
ncbi:hypothetical protein [Pedobacter sp. L105]|uniref:hypothetical protein n=1 Tax=Pedobacter sp. L105 TaxID=1641871 RepID=UPI00131C0866|nr:hypothetical protein [Pedobacter sp. L105]